MAVAVALEAVTAMAAAAVVAAVAAAEVERGLDAEEIETDDERLFSDKFDAVPASLSLLFSLKAASLSFGSTVAAEDGSFSSFT